MSLFCIKNKTCIVTGAGRGIGYEIAKSLSNAGAIVTGVDIFFKEKNCNFSKEIVDLSKSKEIISFCNKFNKLDVLINCAGITLQSEQEYNLDDWNKTLNINLTAPFLLTKLFKSILKESNSPSVINISSLNGKLAFPNNPAYVASKTGLDGLTRSFALDYGRLGIRVNSIAPGYIKTNMTGDSWNNIEKRKKRESRTMLGRWGTPEDIASTALFLASDASKYITGQTIYVDGGWSSKGF
jgi:NAD(P)-dependent dehydrogenase (short-subunit alcohol dehydrogenase family)